MLFTPLAELTDAQVKQTLQEVAIKLEKVMKNEKELKALLRVKK